MPFDDWKSSLGLWGTDLFCFTDMDTVSTEIDDVKEFNFYIISFVLTVTLPWTPLTRINTARRAHNGVDY